MSEELSTRYSIPLDLINDTPMMFTDISSEKHRTYVFAGNNEVKIEQPRFLSVGTGGHRILDSSGISHYVPKGWIHLMWEAKEGKPHFVK